jgi:hypothetical protein
MPVGVVLRSAAPGGEAYSIAAIIEMLDYKDLNTEDTESTEEIRSERIFLSSSLCPLCSLC